MIERHYDYGLLIPSFPSGTSILQYPLAIQTDAPFVCTGIGIHIAPPTATRSQADVQQFRFRFRNAAGDDLSQIPVQTPNYFAQAFGQNGLYRPVWPHLPYPPGGFISIDAYNDSADNLSNVMFIFRGKKLYPDGALANPTYPPKCRPLDFTYQSGKGTPTDAALILNPSGPGSTLIQVPFVVQADADFVLRGGQAGLWTSDGGGVYSNFGYTELYMQLFDSSLNPYSNIPMPIDWIFGNAGGTELPGFTQLGNSAPGLFVPEIYLRKQDALYFSLFRQDGPYVGVTDNLPVRISIAWIGSKIFS